MNIVIADDEMLIRSTLISMLEELNMSIRIVGEAANGDEMVELIRKHSPDIAFVDIRMPKLNGLDAIKAVKSHSPHTQWIILTGFSEFEYAKEAIKLGASEYLLKPVSPEELKEVIYKNHIRSREYKLSLNREFENELVALFHDLTPLPDQEKESLVSNSLFACSIFVFDSYLDEKNKSNYQLEFCKAVREAMDELLPSEVRLALFPLPNGELATVGAWYPNHGEGRDQVAGKYFSRIDQIARQLSHDSFSITQLYSDECKNYEILHKRIFQLQNLSSLRAVMNPGRMIPLEEIFQQYESSSSNLLELSNTLIKLSNAYRGKEYLTFMKAAEDVERIFAGLKNGLKKNLQNSLADFILHTTSCKLDYKEDPKQWIKSLREHGELLLSSHPKEDIPNTDVVNQVVAFIEKNYMHEISIGQIADQLSITPNYLSSLFHKKTGTTFMKYLTKVRMLKAKELLTSPNIQVQQAAEKVGYYSTRHFTKLFKEFYGFYPSDYRDQFRND